MASGGSFKFAIDRGGTFTDVFAKCPDDSVRVMKLLSVDPKYKDAPVGEFSIILKYPFNETLFRRKEFDVSLRVSMEKSIPRMSLLTLQELTGSGWELRLLPMHCLKGKESVWDFW